MSTFLDGSASHLVLPHVPFADVKSFDCENNHLLVTDGKAVFQQDALSFNEFIVGCDLRHIEEFGFGNLVMFSRYTQPYPLPARPQQLSVLFGSYQALVQWKPPALAIGASECPLPSTVMASVEGKESLNCLTVSLGFESSSVMMHSSTGVLLSAKRSFDTFSLHLLVLHWEALYVFHLYPDRMAQTFIKCLLGARH